MFLSAEELFLRLHKVYLFGRKILLAGAELYDSYWGEMLVLSGLPGAGKDTWIPPHCPALPQISLDNLRVQMGILTQEKQSAVIHAAQKQAYAYLRKRQPFVWNATNITADIRGRLIAVFESYGANVRIVSLETSWQEEMFRNQKREKPFPEAVIEKC